MTTRRLGVTALVLLLACALAPPAVHGQEEEERIVRRGPTISVFGQEIEIPTNEVHRDPVVCIGCVARIKGEVRDNVVVIFGELELDGARIGKNVVGVFSKIRVRDSYIEDTLVNALGSLDRDSGSGNVVNIALPFGWAPQVHTILFWFRAVGLLLIFIALVGAVSVVPERVETIALEAPARYFSAFFVGLLGYLAFLIVLTLLAATVIGLPAGILFFKVLKWVGVAGVFLSLGRRIGRSLRREMSPLGAVLLSFGFYAAVVVVLSWLGFAGFLMLTLFHVFFWLMFEVPAVGLVILTRFGTQGGAVATTVYAPAATVPPEPTEPTPEPKDDA
ncbi:MAG: hypothetical protein IH848_00690 [Acidobacteria bacterium]|nr:hypothetical protein [Acidobacteriota bacterium]